jgi:transcriptional regulator with XRE-family HTH domain
MPDPSLLKLGENIRHYRRLKGLTQEELAELTGLHRTYIGGIERGERNVSMLNLVRLARTLEVPLSVLLEKIE